MEAEGLESLFPISDIAVMGILPVLARLPRLLRRIRETADAIIAARPDALVIIDSPDFTHRVARRVRKAAAGSADRRLCQPERLGVAAGAGEGDALLCRPRARPAAVRAGGLCPARRPALRLCRPSADRAARRIASERGRSAPPRRRAADRRRPAGLAPVGDPAADGRLRRRAAGLARDDRPVRCRFCRPCRISRRRCARGPRLWPATPRIVLGEAQKFEAFRTARAALAASGTVTLELALAGVPMVGAYKVGIVEEQLKYLIKVPSILLPNLILGENAIPGEAAARLQPGRARRGAGRRHARRAGARGADRGAGAARRADAARRRRRAERPRRARGAGDDRGATAVAANAGGLMLLKRRQSSPFHPDFADNGQKDGRSRSLRHETGADGA